MQLLHSTDGSEGGVSAALVPTYAQALQARKSLGRYLPRTAPEQYTEVAPRIELAIREARRVSLRVSAVSAVAGAIVVAIFWFFWPSVGVGLAFIGYAAGIVAGILASLLTNALTSRASQRRLAQGSAAKRLEGPRSGTTTAPF